LSGRCNLQVALDLATLLEAAGANVRLTRTEDEALSVDERIRRANRRGGPRYIRIEHQPLAEGKGTLFARRFPGSTLISQFAEPILQCGSEYLKLEIGPISDCGDKEIKDTRGPAVAFVFQTLGHASMKSEAGLRSLLSQEAYILYRGIAAFYNAPKENKRSLDIRVLDASSGAALEGTSVSLGNAERLYTDASGTVRFIGLPYAEILVEATKEGYRPAVTSARAASGKLEILLSQ